MLDGVELGVGVVDGVDDGVELGVGSLRDADFFATGRIARGAADEKRHRAFVGRLASLWVAGGCVDGEWPRGATLEGR